ncbi:PH domain-containing protein [Caulobacter sp. 17J65-9]|uniref:PH domain-containing protein n=1 Tax=Caulobacter sp. 17J65-9 TaxID=2709382 RepID=UPI0013CC942F|nr:PH domain-containing protein [Caulobacter sp. 17J65-9]NEX95041.1 PH domain-containing protein [Caulobacter sp. 17J65-9]
MAETNTEAATASVSAAPALTATGYLAKVLGKDERVLMIVRRHWLVGVSKTALWVGLTFAALVLAAVLLVQSPNSPAFLAALVAALLPAVLWLWEWLSWRNHMYVMTDRRVLQLKGVLSKDVIDTLLEKLNDVKSRQSLWGRIFGYGDIEILTASDVAINKLRTITDPLQFKLAMLEAKDALELDHHA